MKRSQTSRIFQIVLTVGLVTAVCGALATASAQRSPNTSTYTPNTANPPPKRDRGSGGNASGLLGAIAPLVIEGLKNAEEEKRRERRPQRVRRTPPSEPSEPSPQRTRRTPPPAAAEPEIVVVPPIPPVPPARDPEQLFADTPPMPLNREAALAEQPEFPPNEIVLLIRGEDPDTAAADIGTGAGLVLQDSIALTLLDAARIYRYLIPDGRTVDTVLAQLAGTPGVDVAVPNTYYRLQSGWTAALSPAQYALPRMRIPDAQEIVKGDGVTVAVIDSAADLSHPALKNANLTEIDALEQGVYAPHEHGTAIAGIIAASGDMTGIAPNARIISVRAFAPERLGAPPITTVYALIRSVDRAFVAGARIFNMSFAGAENSLFIEIIDDAYARGSVFIAAAGNQGPDAPPAYPAAHDKVIAITATDEADEIFEGANRGGYVLAAAPGVEILAPVTNEGFDFLSGTSFAAAHVTGVIALMMERNPDLTAEDVRQVLVESAHDLGPDGRDKDFGAGLTDAYEALQIAGSLHGEPGLAGTAARAD